MNLETEKLTLIQRLSLIKEESIIRKVEELLNNAELQARIEESEKAIEKGEVITIDELEKDGLEWLKKNATK